MYQSNPRAPIPPPGNPRAFDFEKAPDRRAFDFDYARTVGHLTLSKPFVNVFILTYTDSFCLTCPAL